MKRTSPAGHRSRTLLPFAGPRLSGIRIRGLRTGDLETPEAQADPDVNTEANRPRPALPAAKPNIEVTGLTGPHQRACFPLRQEAQGSHSPLACSLESEEAGFVLKTLQSSPRCQGFLLRINQFPLGEPSAQSWPRGISPAAWAGSAAPQLQLGCSALCHRPQPHHFLQAHPPGQASGPLPGKLRQQADMPAGRGLCSPSSGLRKMPSLPLSCPQACQAGLPVAHCAQHEIGAQQTLGTNTVRRMRAPPRTRPQKAGSEAQTGPETAAHWSRLR